MREYIDTPVNELLEKQFSGEYKKFGLGMNGTKGFIRVWDAQSDLAVVESLTDLFKAADRRIGKDKLVQWSVNLKNYKAYKVICVRLYGWEGITNHPK